MAKANLINNFKTEIREHIVKEEVKVSLPSTVQLDLTMREASFLMGLLGKNFGGQGPSSRIPTAIYDALKDTGMIMDWQFRVKSNAHGNWEVVR